MDGKTGAKPERYEIESVKKHKGDDWVVTARIKYGEHDLKVPMVVQVYWAGDTPMISLTELRDSRLGNIHVASHVPRTPLRRHLAARRSRRPSVGPDRESEKKDEEKKKKRRRKLSQAFPDGIEARL